MSQNKSKSPSKNRSISDQSHEAESIKISDSILKFCANTDKNGFLGVLPVQANYQTSKKPEKTYKNLNTKKY